MSEGVGMENVDTYIFYGRLKYFTAACDILWPFGTYIAVIWYNFPFLGIMFQQKSGNPAMLLT
jgi:hypothetical protein